MDNHNKLREEPLHKSDQENDQAVNNNQPSNPHNINMPNTIKYPKGGSLTNENKQSQPNETKTNTNNKENNKEDQSTPKPKKKVDGKLLVCLITLLICYEYYIYVFQIKPIKISDFTEFNLRILTLTFFHIFLIMMVWSLIVTMSTHPGEIPLYWGFYIGDEEYKRKRYCLICNAFKPERSHHCSVCNVCVLNMDHHCPWVNNCIGFYNRKFFMQLLFYLFCLLWYIALTSIVEIYTIVKHCYTSRMHLEEKIIVKYCFVLIAYSVVLVLTVLNSMFFRYHVKLVLTNSTTIESLDPDNKDNVKFNINYSENWTQVFGYDKILWFFPVISESGRPNGDGLNWRTSSAYEVNINNSQYGKESQSGIGRNNNNMGNNTNNSISQYATNHYNSNVKN